MVRLWCVFKTKETASHKEFEFSQLGYYVGIRGVVFISHFVLRLFKFHMKYELLFKTWRRTFRDKYNFLQLNGGEQNTLRVINTLVLHISNK